MKLNFSAESLTGSLNIDFNSFSEFIEALDFGPVVSYRIAEELLGENFQEEIKKLESQLVGTGYIITNDPKEQYFYLEYRSSHNKFGNPIKKKIGALKAMVQKLIGDFSSVLGDKQVQFEEIDFKELKIGETRFRDHEFVEEVLSRISDIFGTKFELNELNPEDPERIESSLRSEAELGDGKSEQQSEKESESKENTSEKIYLSCINLFGEGTDYRKTFDFFNGRYEEVILAEDIATGLGIQKRNISDKLTAVNAVLRNHNKGIVIKSLGKTKELRGKYVLCKSEDFESIRDKYLESEGNLVSVETSGNNKSPVIPESLIAPVETIGEIQITIPAGLDSIKSRTEKLWELYKANVGIPIKPHEITSITGIAAEKIGETHGSLKKKFTVPEGMQIKTLGKKYPGFVYAPAEEVFTIKAQFVENEGMRSGNSNQIGVQQENNISEENTQLPDLEGEKFRMSHERAFKIVEENKKWINLKNRKVKGVALTHDEFIFCLLCAEDQEVGIDEDELRRNLLQGVQLSWNDVIQLKNGIVTKLGDKKVEFIIPTKGSILLREKLGDDGINKSTKLLEYLRKNRRVLVQKKELLNATGCKSVDALLITMGHVRGTDRTLMIQIGDADDFKGIFFGTEAEFEIYKADQANNTDSLGTDVEILAKRGQINKLGFEYRGYLFQEGKALRKIYNALFLSENGRIKSKKDISEHITKINEHFAVNNIGQRVEIYGNSEENRYILVSIKVSITEKKEISKEIEDCSSLFSPTSLEFTWYQFLYRNKGSQTLIQPPNKAGVNRPLSSFLEKINDTLKARGKNQRVRIIKQKFGILEFYENNIGDSASVGNGGVGLGDLARAVTLEEDGNESNDTNGVLGGDTDRKGTGTTQGEVVVDTEIVQKNFDFAANILEQKHFFRVDFLNFGIDTRADDLNFGRKANGNGRVDLDDIELVIFSYFLKNIGNPKSSQGIMNDLCLSDEELSVGGFTVFLRKQISEIVGKLKIAGVNKRLYIQDNNGEFLIPSEIKRIVKGGIIFLWNERTGDVSYKEGNFNINDLAGDSEILGYISRLFLSDNDTINLLVKGKSKNTNDRRNEIDDFFKDKSLPFGCHKVYGRRIEFGVKN